MIKRSSLLKILKLALPLATPILISLAIGSTVLYFAGINDCGGCSIFKALLSMQLFGWLGVAHIVFAMLYIPILRLIYKIKLRNKTKNRSW